MTNFFSVSLPALGSGATDWVSVRPIQVVRGFYMWLVLQYDCGQDTVWRESHFYGEPQRSEEWVNRDRETKKEVVFTHDLGHHCTVEAMGGENKFDRFREHGIAVYAVIAYGDTGAHRVNIRANGVDVPKLVLPDLPRIADVIPGELFYFY